MTSRLERLIKLDLAIRKGNFPSVEKLCRIVEIQPRTLFQDLRELRENLGCDVRYDRARRGYYNGSPGNRLPTFALTNEELVMISVASELFSRSGGSAVSRILQGALSKIIESYPDKHSISPEELQRWLRTVPTQSTDVGPAHIADIFQALKDEKFLLASFPNSRKSEIVKPYCVLIIDGEWELVAYSVSKKKMCSYRLADVELSVDPDGAEIEQPQVTPQQLEDWISSRTIGLKIRAKETLGQPQKKLRKRK